MTPFQAVSAETGDPSPSPTTDRRRTWLRSGRGLHRSGLLAVIADAESGEPAACGDILEADADEFEEAGQALVQVLPTGDAGVRGYAVVDRLGMQRELDVTPTLIRILLFGPPATE